jgi:Xaa-Pro aminopeptidase
MKTDSIDDLQYLCVYVCAALFESRVVKSPEEIDIIRYANKISSAAHTEVQQIDATACNGHD